MELPIIRQEVTVIREQMHQYQIDKIAGRIVKSEPTVKIRFLLISA